jgi:hypothetical protein
VRSQPFRYDKSLFLFGALYLGPWSALRCPILDTVYVSLRFLSNQPVDAFAIGTL